MAQPQNLQRIAVLRLEELEECVLAVAQGPTPGIVETVLPHDFVVVVSFAKLGPGFMRTEHNGKRYWVMPVLEREPTMSQSFWLAPFANAGAALHQLEIEKAKLLEAGWLEVPPDPVNDPD